MISDTIFEALVEIESYQTNFSAIYEDISESIYKVTTVMKSLQTLLDVPPQCENYPKYNAAKTRLQTEIEAIEVNGLLGALHDLKMSWPSSGSASGISAKD
ncbi:MAG: hypothetical protein MN733_32965 [Nitrososphaera sp.]|nr:hypothetical protein [Nitrososphaera sp.]